MKKLIVFFFALLMAHSSDAQKIIGGKLTWLLSSGGGDARLSYTLKSTGLIGGTGAYGYTGVESVELLLRNNTSHKLLVTVSYTLTNTCNETKTFQKEEALAPDGNTDSKGAFYTGVDYETTCKAFRKIGDQTTVIKNVGINLISIEDITEKEAMAKKRSEEEAAEKRRAVAERKAEEERTKAAQQRQAAAKETTSKSTPSKTTTTSATSSTTASQNKPATSQNTQPTAASKQAEADRRYQEEMNKYNTAMKAAEEKRQSDAQQSQQLAEGVTQFAGAIIGNIRADAERKAERQQQEATAIARNKEKGELLLRNFLSLAEEGNEEAIAKVDEAYTLIDRPYRHYDEIRKDGYYSTYEPKKYLDFLTRMYNEHGSTTAKTSLVTYYTNVVQSFEQVVKDHKRKAIVRPLLAGAVAFGGLVGGQMLVDQEIKDEVASGKVGPTITPGVLAQTVGVLGGATLFLSGVLHLVRVGQTKSDENFIEAKKKLGKVQGGERLSLAPMYDSKNGNWGLAFQLHF